MSLTIGTTTATPGETTTGWLEVAALPTGLAERLPVIIAQGETDGPTVWVTGAIHGNEVTGLAAAQDAMADDLPDQLNGTVVCLPIVNPAGVRRNVRTSYYHDDDPNRYFPYQVGEQPRPPRLQEQIDRQLFDLLVDTADALISLHTAGINERAFTILERVRYGPERTKEAAEELAAVTEELVEAFGVPPVREYDVDIQETYGLQRSLECAALNAAGIPAFTPELGSHSVVEEANRRAAVTGIHNVLRAMDMLPGDPEPNTAAPADPVEYPVKRVPGPYAPTTGLLRERIEPGDVLEADDPIADIVTPHGEPIETVTADHDGYVLARTDGIAVYENDSIGAIVARDDGELVVEASDDGT
ncbi:MAG: succinylglutamate desuccinylase/aspartoacylase family protein [Halobacteriales archaeon]|nr:succinylglutamate desuccinylase/aspartoacylase family protein [Halobacteriales archaeon]